MATNKEIINHSWEIAASLGSLKHSTDLSSEKWAHIEKEVNELRRKVMERQTLAVAREKKETSNG